MASNRNGNPFVQQVNQTALGNILSTVSQAGSNLMAAAQGELGPVGSIIAGLAGPLSQSGIAASIVGSLISSNLDQLISGAESYFAANSPLRIPINALSNRNSGLLFASNPLSAIEGSRSDTTGGTSYVYPPESAPYNLKLDFHNYQRPDPFGDVQTSSIGSVTLPMPDGNGLCDTTSAQWTSASLGMYGNIYNNLGLAAKIKAGGMTSENANTVGNATLDASLYAIDKLGSQMSTELTNTAESATGLVPNPSLAMLFQGIDFRTFQFTWMFAPKSAQDSETIRDLSRFIKRCQMPTYAGQATSLIMNYPAIVKPSFSDGARQFMTDFKWCCVTGVDLRFSPQGAAPSFYSTTKAPAFVQLTISLSEIEYVLSSDYGGNARGASSFDAGQTAVVNALQSITGKTGAQ